MLKFASLIKNSGDKISTFPTLIIYLKVWNYQPWCNTHKTMPYEQLFHLSEYAHLWYIQIQIQHCMFHSLPIILGVLVLVSMHEGVKTMYFHTSIMQDSRILGVFQLKLPGQCNFDRSTHTLELLNLVKNTCEVLKYFSIHYLMGGGDHHPQ